MTKKQEQQIVDRKQMEQMIAQHQIKERQKIDFRTCFQFSQPNKHLPVELKQIEEIKQYMVQNSIDEMTLAKQLSTTSRQGNEFALLKSGEDLIENTASESQSNVKIIQNKYVDEMASKTIKDFKKRSRSNVTARVAKRIDDSQRRAKEKLSSNFSSSSQVCSAKKKSKPAKLNEEKVMSYAEIKKWNEKYSLDGKNVYQLDAEFTSLVKI